MRAWGSRAGEVGWPHGRSDPTIDYDCGSTAALPCERGRSNAHDVALGSIGVERVLGGFDLFVIGAVIYGC